MLKRILVSGASVLIAVVFVSFLAGCGKKHASIDKNVITIWAHQGQEAEVVAIKAIIDSFNVANKPLRADLKIIPSGFKHSYEDKVSAAALAGQLPDIMDMDGPFVSRYAWSNILQPVDQWFSAQEKNDFLPSIIKQGTYKNRLYALGAFESSVVLYYNANLFKKYGIKAPKTIKEAWDWKTFEKAARKLNQKGKRVGVSFKMDYGPGEWYTYGFTPLLWSREVNLLSKDMKSASGFINSKEAQEVLSAFQKLFKDSIASANPAPEVFENGKAAMEWNGHWVLGKYEKIKKFHAGVMPLPRFGNKQITPCGSWCWGVTKQCAYPEKAVKLLKWIVGTKTGIVPMVKANGAPPARFSAYKLMPEYRQMPRSLFFRQLQATARPRPVVPYYSVLTSEFSKALHNIALGADVKKTLDASARAIDVEIKRGRYFEAQ